MYDMTRNQPEISMSVLMSDTPPIQQDDPLKAESRQGRDDVALSIVIPAYNEANRLSPTLREIDKYIGGFDYQVELIVVNDGSEDKTSDVVLSFAPESRNLKVRLLENVGNRGKGYSVKRGVLESVGEIVLMADADNSTPITEYDKLAPWLDRGYDVVIGSRDMPDSVLDPPQPWWRKVGGGIFRRMRRAMLLSHIKDTQCGFKCFTRKAGRAIFTQVIVDGFAFDCEVLALAEKLDFKVREVGVYWVNNDDSRVRPVRDFMKALKSLSQIRKRMSRFN